MISWELAVSCGIDWEWFDKVTGTILNSPLSETNAYLQFIKYNTTNNAKFTTAIMAKYESLVRNKLREVFISYVITIVPAGSETYAVFSGLMWLQ